MASGKDLVSAAKSYIGKVQYVFGADDIKNGKGDCSSFTSTIYRDYGIEIGRDTQAQWQSGAEVSKDNLSPGDLVFFKDTYNSGHKDGVSHVGIFTGGTTFVHLGNKGVSESDLNSEYWTAHWLGARRMPEVTVSDDQKNDSNNGQNINLSDKGFFENIAVAIIIVFTIIAAIVFLCLSVGINPKKII